MGKQLSIIARNDFEQIEKIVSGMTADAEKFYEKGNKLAGTRLRNGYLEISKICVSARANVQTIKRLNPPVSKKLKEEFL